MTLAVTKEALEPVDCLACASVDIHPDVCGRLDVYQRPNVAAAALAVRSARSRLLALVTATREHVFFACASSSADVSNSDRDDRAVQSGGGGAQRTVTQHLETQAQVRA